jgi:hypothetical protein
LNTHKQYALDFDVYIKWKAVAALLAQPNDRLLFQKRAGDMILESKKKKSTTCYVCKSNGVNE